MIKVGINGFGRIGRMVLQAGLDDSELEFVAVNDLSPTKELAYLFRYDSAHGLFDGEVSYDDENLIINGKKARVYAEKDPTNIPWGEHDIDVVVESTGLFRTREKAGMHLKAGAKKVLVSAPCKCAEGEEPVKTIVIGVNEHDIDKDKDVILSNASCTTNCLAPMVKVLNDNFKIKRGLMTTIHAYTADQRLVDASHRKDPRRGRAAAMNIVPTTTGAAKAVTEVIPELKGKMDGMAMRVPVVDGSITDFTCELGKEVTIEQINELFRNVSEHHLKGILEYTEDPIVSHDVIGNPHSCIFDSALTKVMDKNFVKVVGWYDNEYGYSKRMVDVLKLMF